MKRFNTGWVSFALVACAAPLVWATDIEGVQPAALDQPRINAYIALTAGGEPLSASVAGLTSFNVQAFFDTGASGLLLSNETADLLGLNRSTFGGQSVVYSDVGVAGSDNFNVSDAVYMGLAPYHPDADVDNLSTYSSVYNQTFGPVRTQIGPVPAPTDPNLQNLDVLGTPAMAGRVVVMDPKPVDSFLDTMRTYVYTPGTPYNTAEADTNPGIPLTNRHIKLSYGSFDRFTTVTPAGAPGPTLADNPFIGPNPVAAMDGDHSDTTPSVTIEYNGNVKQGSFLLDTGSAASMISKSLAASLGVTYAAGTEGTDDPVLSGVPLDHQFQMTIGGIGGTTTVAGFYLDNMAVPTMEQDPLNYLGAPVLVSDITVKDPLTQQSLTLDGIFGMNNLVATALVIPGGPLGIQILNETGGAYDWLVYDPTTQTLGVDLKDAYVPEPGSATLLVFAALFAMPRRRVA